MVHQVRRVGNLFEPAITMNGQKLTSAQCMMIRCAIENFSSDLVNNGLGNDEHGKTMVKLYMERIEEVRKVMYGNT